MMTSSRSGSFFSRFISLTDSRADVPTAIATPPSSSVIVHCKSACLQGQAGTFLLPVRCGLP